MEGPAEEELRLRAETAARDLAVREQSLTFAMALRDCVEKKRRNKDGLPLAASRRAAAICSACVDVNLLVLPPRPAPAG
jgi:hypothetical protein